MKNIPSFRAFLISILMVLFAVAVTWADPVSLTPYTNDDTGESFYYVNMPYTAATSCTQAYSNPVAATASLDIVETDFDALTDANGRISFRLYDDGGMGESISLGAEGSHHNCVNSTLIVTVPENYRLSAQGRMNTEGAADYMFIYDASDNSGTPLGGRKIYGSYYQWEEKGPYVSTGNALTFFFETDYTDNYAGFDFTVSVLPVYTVTVNSVSNGEMAGTMSAVEGETVSLTATPSEGYVFGGIKVLDENGNRVPVNMNGNTVTFTMPATPVTVTPHFGNPEILSFDDDGCLDNGTFFLVKCEDNACTIAQGTEGSQGDGFMSFACWSDMVQYIEEDEGRLSSMIVLGSPLNLGGYDEDAGNCRMAFVPFGSNHAGFDGNENTVDGFCGKDAGNGSWFVYANYVKNVSLTNAYVYGLSAYLISGNTISNVTVDRATIIGGTGAGVIGNAASIGNVTVKNSNIHVGEYIEGSTIETVYAGALMAQMRTVEWSGPVLLQGNTVSAENDLMGAYLGGVVGEVEGYSTSVNLTGISVEDATVNGGANGYYVGGLVGANSRWVSVAISQCSFTGTVSGGVVGGIIGHADNYESQVIIKNTYSVSTISGTTAGYIVGNLSGGANVDFEGVSLFNNYHFGSDEVELGVGSVNGSVYEVARWMAGSGNVFGNVRNATEKMTATAMGNYRYDYGCMEDEVYWDFFMFSYSTWQEELDEGEYEDHADFDAATRNAVASEADMKSDMFAALLNRNPADYDAEYVASEHNIWSRSSTQNDELPVFASGSLQPNRIVVVAEKSSMGLTLEQESSLGFNEWSGSFCETYGSVSKAMIGYTDASGLLSSDFQEKVGALLETIASNMGTDAAMLVDKQGNEVLLSAALSSNQEWRVVTPKTYDVVYQYCDYQNVCRLFENVTGTLLAFLTPRVDQYTDKADAPLQLVPNVVSYYAQGWTEDELKFTFELQDEEGYSVDDAALGTKTPEGTDIWSFEDIAQKIRAAGVEGVKTIVLKYATPSSSYGEFPLITVQNPKMVDMEIDVYGYDRNSSMVQVAQSSASGENDGITEGRVDYGVAVGIGEIQSKTGYTFDNTYSVAYQYIATLDNCTAPEPKNYVVTNKSFGSFDDLSAEMTACGTVEWKVEGLNVGDADDLVVLNNVKMASFAAKKKYGNSVTEKLVIVPSYSLIHYNVSFDLNLPEGIEDNSFIFFGRSWDAVKDLTVEGPDFPKIYTNACPTMIAWSPKADASEVPSWYFEASYYKNYVHPNFLSYATLDVDNGNATTAYVYWKEDDCSDPQVISFNYVPKLKGASVATSPATLVLKQRLNSTTTIDHPMQVGDDQWYLQLPDVDDTMTFVVDVDVEKGYTISEITYEGIPKDDHGVVATDEEFTLGFNDPETGDRTLSVNTAMVTSGELTIDFDYANYEVNFVRPTNELAVSLADKEVYVAYPYTNEGWFDARAYTMANVDDEYASAMPELYALNGCVAWSTTSSYDAMTPVYRKFDANAVQNFGNSTELYPVYFTAEDNANLCGDAPTETFTVTAHGENLTKVELLQVIGVKGDNTTADTIRHTMTRNDAGNEYTLEVPAVKSGYDENQQLVYVPFTFIISAEGADGYAVYDKSFYQLSEIENQGTGAGDEVTVTYDTTYLTSITVFGADAEFNVHALPSEYEITFDTTRWDSILNVWSNTNYIYDYEFYAPSDFNESGKTYMDYSLNGNDESRKLPKLFASSFSLESVTGTNISNVLSLQWTFKNDTNHCVLGALSKLSGVTTYYCVEEGFEELSAGLIREADTLVKDGKLTLYPVWEALYQQKPGYMEIDCESSDTYDCEADPVVIELSQTVTMGGKNYVFKHSSAEHKILLPQETGKDFVFDISIKPNVGFTVANLADGYFEDPNAGNFSYDADNGKFYLNDASFENVYQISYKVPSYGFVDYTVTFDMSTKADSVVVLGSSFESSKTMNLSNSGRTLPNTYILRTNDEGYEFWPLVWSYQDQDNLVFGYDGENYIDFKDAVYSNLNVDLLEKSLGENTDATEITLYPINPMDNNISDNDEWISSVAASTIKINAVDAENNVLTANSDYHGAVILSQTAGDVTFSQTSQLVEDASNATFHHEMYVPKVNDALTFDVSFELATGYTMSIDTVTYEAPDSLYTDDWGYNETTQTLKIRPNLMTNLVVKVRYEAADYEITFTRPTGNTPTDTDGNEVEYFVADGFLNGNWTDTKGFAVTEEDLSMPGLYTFGACIGWSTGEGFVENETFLEFDDQAAAMLGYADTLYPVYFTEEQSSDVCVGAPSEVLTITVHSDGNGTVELWQIIGVTDEDAGTTADTIRHTFTLDETNSTETDKVYTLTVPKAMDDDGSVIPFTFEIHGVPASSAYFLPEDGLYTFVDGGNGMTMTNIADGSSFVVDGNDQELYVKFTSYGPYFVAYDLNAAEEDLKNIYLPRGAVPTAQLTGTADMTTLPLLTPVNTERCFIGWSTAAEPADQETDIFAAMSADILYTLSADVEKPTTLHAVWETCTAEKTTALTLKNGDEHSTLVVYQLFGDDILPHTVPVEGINLESASFTDGENSYTGYQFYLDQENTLPHDGYSLDLETVTLSYVVGAADPVTVNAVEGAWTVSEDGLEGVPTFIFAPSVEPLEFNLVFDVNSTGVYYGIDWTLERDGVTVTSDDSELMFPLTLKNTAACFSGWALTDDAEMGYYNLADPNFLEEIVAAETEFITEENDDGLLVEKPIYRLYGVWDATCEQRLYPVSTEVPVEQGFFRIYQVVDGDTIAVNVNADETATLVSSDSVQFKVAFVPATGYSLSADATVEVTYKNDTEEAVASIAAGETYAFNDGISATKAVLSVTGLSADDYTLVFNENAATATEKPFFGDSWSDYITVNTFDRDDDDNWTVSVGYSMSGSTDFPMELYRNGFELKGYTFDKDDTANGLYTALTAAFIDKYIELGKEGPVNMYAYWLSTEATEGFTVANADSTDGTLVLERKFALDADSYTPAREYTVAGTLVVPSAAGNVSFTGVRFELGETAMESKILDTQMPYAVKVGEAVDWADLSGDLSVAGNTLVKSPLLNSAYEFAYSQNVAEGVNVFFNSQAWEWTASLLIGDDEGSVKLPDETALARPEACFEGWALDASGKTAYSQFDVVMLRALDSAVAAGGKVDTLYAVWNTTLSDCYPETFVVNTDMTAEKGVFAVSQHVGDAVFNYEMGEDGLVVPKLQGAELTVDFEPGPAYEMDGDIFGVTDAGDTLFSMIEGSFFTLPETIGNVSTLTLGAHLLMTTPEFALNLNAEGADVFYEDDFTSLSWTAEQYGDTIPSGIHRIDAVLEGWKLGSVESEVVYKTFGNDLMDAYNAYVEQEDHVEPVPLYAVWQADGETEPFVVTSESSSEGTLVLKQVFGEDTLTYEVGESGLAVPGVQGLHFIAQFTADYEHTVAEGNPVKLMDVSGIVIDSIANGGTFAISGSTVIKVMTQEDKYELVFDANTDVILFYGTEWVAEKSYDMGNLDEDRSFPRSLYRTDACLEGFAFSKDVAATEDAYYREIDESFVEEFKSAERTAPTTLYAVWGDDCGLPYTVTTVNAAEEGSFTLVNAVGEMSNEFPVTESGLKVPYGEDLEFTVVFTPTNAYDFDGTMMMVSSDNEETELDAGAPVNFIEDTRLKAVTELHGVHFALDVKADTVFFGHDFSFDWKADKLGLLLPKNIFRSHAMLTGWSFSLPADAANPDGYVFDPESPIAEGEDLPQVFQYTPGVHTAYDEGFMQDYRAYVAYYGEEPDTLAAVWEDDETVARDPVISKNPDAGEFILAQDVGDSVFTYDITSDTLWIPSVPEGLEFRIMFKAAQSRVLMNDSSLSVTDNEKQSSLENGGVFVMTGGAIALAAETYFKGAHLVFNVGEEKPFFGSDWKAEGDYAMHSDEDVTALPLVLYTSEKCLAGWTTEKSDSATLYTEFNGTLMEELSSNTEFADQKATLYAAWTDDVYSCQGGFTRVMIEQENGVVSLLDGAKEETHEFIDGSMVLPYEMNGKDLEVVSMADSSYVLDSLVLTYGFDEPYHYEAYGEDMELRSETLYEGDHLPEILDRVKFVAYFGKSNKTPVRIVEKDLAQTGNVVKLSFKASDFEVTRGVTARVQVVDVLRDSVVVSMLLGDSVAMGFECDTMIRMSRSGEYRMELTLEDELEMDEYSKEFSVKSTIDAFEADGWQMVSLAAVDTSAIDWVSGDQLFYWWDENGTGEYWQYKQFTQGDSVVATRGAWYSSLKGQSLKLRQDMEDEGSDIVWNLDSVTTGWNLVANPHGWAVDLFANRPDQKQKEVDEETEAIFYSYNAKTGDYDPVDTLKPYEAVWVQVSKQTEWIVDATPVFAPKTSEDDGTKPEEEKEPRNPALPKRVLAKSFTQNRWTLQAVLSDQRGKQDAWNILGVGLNSFGVEEPPASMGDHVNLSIMDGKRALTKSIKSSGDEMEWTVTLSASSDRLGYLTLMGIEDVKAYGYHVFVTVDGNTTEMQNGEPLKVYLKSSAKTATVRVTKAAQVAVKNTLKGLRSARLGDKLKVSFVATEDLAGTNARVDLMDMKGHVMATVTGKTVEGSNALVLDAPQTGLYMLRVRAGSAQQAGKIMVK